MKPYPISKRKAQRGLNQFKAHIADAIKVAVIGGGRPIADYVSEVIRRDLSINLMSNGEAVIWIYEVNGTEEPWLHEPIGKLVDEAMEFADSEDELTILKEIATDFDKQSEKIKKFVASKKTSR
jgi:hypothetical protein